MTLIDRSFVKKSFATSAATYDCYAGLQYRMNTRLIERYCTEDLHPMRMLDIGMGTGNLGMQLLRRFPNACLVGCDLAAAMIERARLNIVAAGLHATGLVADAEQLPFMSCSFDLAASAFTFQWLEDWSLALNEIQRVLRPGGVVLFSAFGSQTFYELRSSYRAACDETGYDQGEALQLATTAESVSTSFAACNLCDLRIETLTHVSFYPTVNDLMRAIKGMGARNASARRNRTAGVRAIWNRMVAHYSEEFGCPTGIPATFEIIMGAARKL
ncbi:MAG: methyltransferase domain-containing protein [Desulfobacterota bacterium]|nr:methyltransferase domain-containing protein [Thermodesulfobacteriota bacterium]